MAWPLWGLHQRPHRSPVCRSSEGHERLPPSVQATWEGDHSNIQCGAIITRSISSQMLITDTSQIAFMCELWGLSRIQTLTYRKVSKVKRTKSSREWRCSSKYIWVIDNFIAFSCATYIRGLTVCSVSVIAVLYVTTCYIAHRHNGTNCNLLVLAGLFWGNIKMYHKISNISCTKSPNLNVPCPVLKLSLPNPMKPGVKSRMKM